LADKSYGTMVRGTDTSNPKGVSDRMVATLNLFGKGNQQPALSDQKALFEFAQMLYQELIQ